MNNVKVLFFATLKDLAGVKETMVELPQGALVRDLKTRLQDEFPGLPPVMSSVLISINREFAFDEDLIPPGAEIALFPPVSGGSVGEFPTICAITEGEIDVDDLLTRITLPSTGATCCFFGMVRGVTERAEPHRTLYLEYEAYQPMAEAKMQQVADEIRTRWPTIEGIAIVQRVGRLDPGTPTVLVACNAAHRDTGVFDAARYGIDRLKEIVPVWKKEVGPGGEAWVEGKYIPERDD
jgi:molybdopterin converting factor subunit 1